MAWCRVAGLSSIEERAYAEPVLRNLFWCANKIHGVTCRWSFGDVMMNVPLVHKHGVGVCISTIDFGLGSTLHFVPNRIVSFLSSPCRIKVKNTIVLGDTTDEITGLGISRDVVYVIGFEGGIAIDDKVMVAD